MKHTLLLSLVFLFTSFAGISQDIRQVEGLKSFEGDSSDWGVKKGKVTFAQEGFFFLKIDNDVLVLPVKYRNNSREVVTVFLRSGNSTGIKAEVITVFGWNIEQGSAVTLGKAKSIVAEGGGSGI